MTEEGGVSAQKMVIEKETCSDAQIDRAGQERGIDVSNWQGKIDWGRVAKAGIKHVCMKMSEGAKYVDPRFVENWNGANKEGIRIGCYHYFRGVDCQPEQQMENIKKNIRVVNFDPTRNFLSIDVEQTGNENATPEQMAQNLNALLTLMKNDAILSRCPIMFYTSSSYWDCKVKWEKYNFAVYPLWVAHWGAQSPHLPEPWRKMGKNWSWWQHSSKGKVDGIRGDVDLDWVRV